MNDLLRRHAALEKTLARFRGRRLVWGSTDCMHMARLHLIEMGYSPPLLPSYRTQLGARRAMERAGGLCAVFDLLLERIAPAAMLPGDIAVLEGDGGDGAFVCAGHKLLGWHQDSDVMVAITALQITGAWRA